MNPGALLLICVQLTCRLSLLLSVRLSDPPSPSPPPSPPGLQQLVAEQNNNLRKSNNTAKKGTRLISPVCYF